MKSALAKTGQTMRLTPRRAVEAGIAVNEAALTQDEIRSAEKLLEQAFAPRAIPLYSPEERLVLAILAANFKWLQRARGKKSRKDVAAKAGARRDYVNFLLRYIVAKRYRKNPNSLATVMEIVDRLDSVGIEASEPTVRRDIHAALALGPLPTS